MPDGAIIVRTGDRMPGIPRAIAEAARRLRCDAAASPRRQSLIAGSIYARGDENNADANGRVPGYVVVNLDTAGAIDPHLVLFAHIDNLFDRRYANFAILGENVFTGPGRSFGPARDTRRPSSSARSAHRAASGPACVAFGKSPARS